MDPLTSFIRDPSKQNEAWRNDGKYVCLTCNFEGVENSKKCPSCRKGKMMIKDKYFNWRMNRLRMGCFSERIIFDGEDVISGREFFNRFLKKINATYSTDGYRFLK